MLIGLHLCEPPAASVPLMVTSKHPPRPDTTCTLGEVLIVHLQAACLAVTCLHWSPVLDLPLLCHGIGHESKKVYIDIKLVGASAKKART